MKAEKKCNCKTVLEHMTKCNVSLKDCIGKLEFNKIFGVFK